MIDTKLKAYAELKASRRLQPMEQMVLFVLGDGPLIRSEIAERAGMRLSSVCGRVRSLLDAGLIEVRGNKPCPETGKTQELLALCAGAWEALG